MPLEQRNPTRKSSGLTLDLPPPFRLVLLREVGDAVGHARAHAAELGAGTFVFVGAYDLAEFAVILEPEEPLAAARRAFYAGMIALGDALAAAAPPEKPLVIQWPDAIQVDGGLVGGGQLTWPEDTDEQAVPEWLVFGAAIRTVSMSETEVGLHPLATTLEEEGFLDAGSEHLAEAFARHLMIAFDRWQESGFAAIAMDYASRLKPESGLRCEIAENGDLRVLRGRKLVERQSLLPALKAPSWLDPTTGGPRL
jgi:biotin-(acetyl-CoA carboxylase) ligase